MMTIKADDIQGRHQSYADIVQGNNISPPGRTAAFDGLCCELRGLGMEVTLGALVDSFEPLGGRQCVQNEQPKSLEEEFQVSAVDQFERDGVKMLEIPAGDYVPTHRPPSAPIITSVTNGKNGIKPRIEVSQEPLIDDVDESVESFIASETSDILSNPVNIFAPPATAEIDERFVLAEETTLKERSYVVPPTPSTTPAQRLNRISFAPKQPDDRFAIPEDFVVKREKPATQKAAAPAPATEKAASVESTTTSHVVDPASIESTTTSHVVDPASVESTTTSHVVESIVVDTVSSYEALVQPLS